MGRTLTRQDGNGVCVETPITTRVSGRYSFSTAVFLAPSFDSVPASSLPIFALCRQMSNAHMAITAMLYGDETPNIHTAQAGAKSDAVRAASDE